MRLSEKLTAISAALRRRALGAAGLAAMTLALTINSAAHAQMRSEMRDPVRGVSFHSIELSNQAIDELDVRDGLFSPDDRLAVGLSAMVFDGDRTADGYILWVRHEGRAWLDRELIAESVQVLADGMPLSLDPLRSPLRFTGADGLVFEKLEFDLSAAEVSRLIEAESVVVAIRSESGHVEKRIAGSDKERVASFVDSIEESLTQETDG